MVTTTVRRGLADSLRHQVVGWLDAWSRQIARRHADKRRKAEAARQLKAGGTTPRWPGTWHD